MLGNCFDCEWFNIFHIFFYRRWAKSSGCMLPFAVFRCLLLFISGILNPFRSVDAPRMHFSLPMCAICTLNFKKSDKKKCHINWLHMCSQTQKRFRSYSYKPFSIECAGYKQKITNHIIDFASHTISIEPYWGRPLCIVHTCQLYFFSALFPPPSHLLRCNRLSIWYNSIDFSAGKCVYSINLNARIAIYFIENNSNKLFVALFKPDLFFSAFAFSSRLLPLYFFHSHQVCDGKSKIYSYTCRLATLSVCMWVFPFNFPLWVCLTPKIGYGGWKLGVSFSFKMIQLCLILWYRNGFRLCAVHLLKPIVPTDA